MEATFKLAEPSDIDLLATFMRELYQFDHVAFDEPGARTALQMILSDASLGRVWLIQYGEDTIGYIVLTLGFSLEFKGRDAVIDEFYILAPYRGRGLGKQALARVEEACRSLGVQALHLVVERKNTGAQAVYRKAGFEAHDQYLMTKWISP